MTDVINQIDVQNVDTQNENSENLSKSDDIQSFEQSQIEQNTSEKQSDSVSDEPQNSVYGSPDNYDYSNLKLPDGMTLDKDLLDEFNPLAKKFNLSNSSANELLSLAVKLSDKNSASVKNAIEEVHLSEKNSYLQMLNDDKELNTHNRKEYDQYLDVATQGLKAVSTPKFDEFLREKGLTHHPEFIKVFHKIGELCKEASIPDATLPIGTKLSPADILYANSSSK